MLFLRLSLALFFFGGVASLFAGRGKHTAAIGAFSALAASISGLAAVLEYFFLPTSPTYIVLASLPIGKLALNMNGFSAVFLVPILLLVGLCALYGMKNGDGASQGKGVHTGAHWFFYHLLSGGMILTLTAHDGFLFLLAWEAMSIAPFFLITLHDDGSATRSAAWTYLVAAHLGALFLLAFFASLSVHYGGTFDFQVFLKGDEYQRSPNGLCFFFALIGFGAKFGLMPLHVWLPEAHPAAPSHVSALMSGAMVNLGLYGLMRSLHWLGYGEAWWAYTLIVLGGFSAFMGILRAAVQSSIKQALAFSTVENMGIICMGLGVALLCLQNRHPEAAALALTGSLVHMINHSLSKGLLFLCAGSVLHSVGNLSLNVLGGLQKRLPLIGWCFLIGSVAICALPPLNGFAGEFFLYLGLVFGGASFAHSPSPEYSLIFWMCLAVLAATGGLSLLSFTRLYGITFLGNARSDAATLAVTHTRKEQCVIAALALLCAVSAFASPQVARLCFENSPFIQHTVPTAAAANFTLDVSVPSAMYDSGISLLWQVNKIFLLLIAILAAILFLRRGLLRRRIITASETWSCGHIFPTARMQYSGGSFSRPAASILRTALRQKISLPSFSGYFPEKAEASLSSSDWMETKGYVPLFSFTGRIADLCKALQHGRVNGYILYILITLVALLAWKLD